MSKADVETVAAIDQKCGHRDVVLGRDRQQHGIVQPVRQTADDRRIAAEHVACEGVDLVYPKLHSDPLRLRPSRAAPVGRC
jgi:hypothetical protein